MRPTSFRLGLLIASLGILSTAYPKGGESSGGGGDVLICQTREGEKVYLADTFELFYEKNFPSLPFHSEVIEEFFANHIEKENPQLRGKLIPALKKLTFKMSTRIPEFDDDFIKNIPQNCRKQQLAYQDIGQKLVSYDWNLFHKLSHAERAMFRVHEALIQVRARSGDTTPIRNLVQNNYASGAHSPLIRKAAENFRKLLQKDQFKREHFLLWSAVDTCYEMQLKACRRSSPLFTFLDGQFKDICGDYGSACERKFKRMYEAKLASVGLFPRGIPEAKWKGRVTGDGRVWSLFFTMLYDF